MGPLPKVVEVTSRSPEETQRLGVALGKAAQPGDVFLLTGELGTGKTCLTQGIAWGLEVKEYAFSPSFVLVREYRGRLTLYHMDFYRLERVEEIADLGLDDYFYGKGVCVVEWADRALSTLPPEHLLVDIRHLSETERTLTLTPKGQRAREILRSLRSEMESQ
ncbi:MAG: tRNA (adenosine(37)-N6)-threonylcarbamoyltransferase complex ATPase subunit type 1 TsaE [Chloroflexota bacterium]